ncbi:hypothetical protein Sru01_40400 [Sphaerisporangium rufum]|uniref:Protein kinase domain-containing protein n=1 Tax=Sphaerisporangium rufum TaxID=1381558 RepID=A0A919R4P7_9ACTN|nr:serine/threonine-protein kinase [Sphaerisporangium rufum]GII79058.1 hypothetical protein Sru01_40400 [Sphaerisporangium rufum]
MNDLGPGDPPQIGRYRLLGRLGRGGMGTVYLGRDAAGQPAAIKVINPEYARHEEFRTRFRREAEAARRVRRFCTAAVLDADLDGDQLYVVTEYVEGPNLHEAVRDAGPLRGSSLDALAVGVATALTAIHAAGVVHRDLKPSNVLLSPVGPRVIDFGIARALDTLGGITGTGQLLGTPRYMAPEVLRGEPASPACDVFSWGCLVAFAGTATPPFGGDSMPSIMYQVLNTEPSLAGLEEPLRSLVAATLAKDPARRPAAQAILDQMVGRTGPEQAERSVAAAWRQDPTLAGPPSTLTGPPPTVPSRPSPTAHGPAPTGYGPASHAPAATAYGPGGPGGHGGPGPGGPGGQGPGGPGRPGGYGPAPASPAGRAAEPGTRTTRRLRLIGIIAAAVVVAVTVTLGVRTLLPSGPPTDLVYLYQDDFGDNNGGWGGSTYTGEDGSSWGYAPGGFYAVDVDTEHPERVEKAPIPFVPAQPATPDPSATPTPTTPGRLLLAVTVAPRQKSTQGEYGLMCRSADETYKPTRYEFLLTGDGKARIRRVVKGAGGDLPPPAPVSGLDGKDPVRLQAECDRTGEGMRLTMWVNGAEVQSYTDTSAPLPNGDVGFLARVPATPDAAMKLSFDDFSVSGTPDARTGTSPAG